MVRKSKRGASRKLVKKQRQPIVWRNLLQPMAIVLTLVVVIAGLSYTQQTPTLPILHVIVDGKFVHVDKQALVKAVTPYATGSFLSVDVASLREAGEALPWVKQIQVRRVWPDSLHLIVEEQVAVARWKDKWLVNNKGETFLTTQNEIPSGLAILEGPQSSHEVVVQRYQVMSNELAKQGLVITHLEMDLRRAWNMTLSNGIKVVLGRANSEKRFTRFIRVYQDELQKYKAQIAVMDMRYTNGLAVIWKQGQKPNFSGTV
ncbi:MAG: cell division protein FtsQ/DivIB [Methylophagaceae bacterium]